MAQLYNIPYENHFFPLKFSNFDYIGNIPEAKFFGEFKDTMKHRSEKIDFINKFKSNHMMWDFKNQLFLYSDYKLKLFLLSFLNLLKVPRSFWEKAA